MSIPVNQESVIVGEISPSVWGRVTNPKYKNGASTLRNFVVNYHGGGMSRAGFQYVGMCKQGAPNAGGTPTNNPPRDIDFQYSVNEGFALEFGDQYMRVKFLGAYITEVPENVSAITQANPGVITIASHGFSNGDWVFGSNIGGMTGFNGLTWIVQNVTSNTFTLTDLFGTAVNTFLFNAYTSGGTFARIYTVVSPYAAIDLPYLKETQSANDMNLVCYNQQTLTEYPPYDLRRVGAMDWTFTQVSFSSPITPPPSVTSTAVSSTTQDTWYSYVVTSVDANGNESVPSAATDVYNNDIAVNAGSNTITWGHVNGAISSNIYAATPVYTGATAADPGFVGATYGLIGSSVGGQSFTDTNSTPDFTQTPPQHNDPFARGQILDVVPTAGGTGYSQSTVGYTITTATGSGFSGVPIVQSGSVTGFLIYDQGGGYLPGDTIAITGGAGATATLTLGSQTGTYPGAVQYYQQRLVYANTINQPDTYFMSQPGSYANFDTSIPTVDSDAITGTPWGLQINGIQFMVPTINGLLTLTGNGTWLVNGGNSAAITPSDENAQAQAQIGCSAIVPPLFINQHVLYVQSKNSIVRDVAYNFYYNVFLGTDITIFSNHLFAGYTLLQWAYAEEPYKVIWAVRNDGTLLSLTYIKEEEVQAWSRHDTNGLFVGVCAVTEPPVDAIYAITKRYITAHGVWVYYSERANNRIWENVEDSFCVDAGLAYPMTFPNATLMPAAADGTDNISGTIIISGGTGYTAPVIQAVDSTGQGTGATFTYTLSGGIITAVTPIAQGQLYTQGATQIMITDPTGSGAAVQPIITNYVTFTASSSVFSSGMIGDVLRAGGGKATIISQTGTACIANITQPLTDIIPNNPDNMPKPVASGDWSVSAPVTTVFGLNHLEGMTVTGLADGGVIEPQIVTNGSIILPNAASAITVGLGYICQMQTPPLDIPGQTTNQGKRKNIQAVTLRVEQSRGLQVGSNMPDASTQPNNANIPWTGMTQIKQRNMSIHAGSEIPLFTGDTLPELVKGNWDQRCQIATQQVYPLPCTVNALVPRLSIGDQSAG